MFDLPFHLGGIVQQEVFRPPYDSIQIAQTHSQLTAVLAGFAFAAFILLIERYQSAQEQKQSDTFARAMYLLFLAFIVGTISSFLYSSQVGEEYPSAYIAFIFASSAFELHVILILMGIVYVFNAFEKPATFSRESDNTEQNASVSTEKNPLDLLGMIRLIYKSVVVLILLRVWEDNSRATILASRSDDDVLWHLIIGVVVVAPMAVSALLWKFRIIHKLNTFSNTSFRLFTAYWVFPLAILLPAIQGILNVLDQSNITDLLIDYYFVFVILSFLISMIATWGFFLLPQRENKSQDNHTKQ